MHVCYRSDREHSVRARIEEAAKVAGRKATPVKPDAIDDLLVLEEGGIPIVDVPQPEVKLADAQIAVPETTHPSERASNGLAERAVQQWENHFTTLRHAFELNGG